MSFLGVWDGVSKMGHKWTLPLGGPQEGRATSESGCLVLSRFAHCIPSLHLLQTSLKKTWPE